MKTRRFGYVVPAVIVAVLTLALAGCDIAGVSESSDNEDGVNSSDENNAGTSELVAGGPSVTRTLGSDRASAEFEFTTQESEFAVAYTVSVDMPAGTDFDFYLFSSEADRQAVIDAWEARNDFAFVNSVSSAVGSGDSSANPETERITSLSGGTTYYILVVDLEFLGGPFTISVS